MLWGLSLSQILLSVLLVFAALAAILFFATWTATLRQSLTALGVQWALSVALFEYIGIANDVRTYVERATPIIEFVTGEGPPPAGLTKIGLPIIWSVVEVTVGWHPLPAALLLAIPVALIPGLAAYATRLLGYPSVASTSAWLGAIGPPILVWSPWLRREGLSYFLLALLLVGTSWIFSGHLRKGFILITAVIPVLLLTRGQLVFIAVLAISLAVLLSPRIPTPKRGALLAVGGVIALPLMPLAIGSLYRGEVLEASLASFQRGTMGVSFVDYEHNTSIPGVLRNSAHALFGPFPWEWESERWVIFGIDGMFYASLFLLLVFVYQSQTHIRRRFWLLVLPAIPLVLGSAVQFANYGLTSRIRSHVFVLLIPLLAVGLNRLLRIIRLPRVSAVILSSATPRTPPPWSTGRLLPQSPPCATKSASSLRRCRNPARSA